MGHGAGAEARDRTGTPQAPAVARVGAPPVALAAAAYAALAALLSVAAIANRFPLVYADTATYVDAARTLHPPPDRSIVYGLLVRAVTLAREPFLAVAAQALLLAALFVAALRHGAGARRPLRTALPLTALLVATTGLSVTVGHLLPDVLAPAAILALGLLLATPAPVRVKAAAWVTLAIGAAAHASILVLAVLVCGSALAWRAIRRRRHPLALVRHGAGRRVAVALGAVAAGALALATLNGALGAAFALVPGAPVFLVGRMAQTGLLEDVLAARCPAAGWRLCAHRAEIPRDIDAFLWAPGSAAAAMGGFGPAGIAEAASIVRASFGEPSWIGRQAWYAVRGTARQLVRFDLRWVHEREGTGGWVRRVLAQAYPGQVGALDASRQRQGGLRFWPVERAQKVLVIASAALAVVLLARRRRHPATARAFAAVLLAGVVANAAACGALASPNDRYGARVAFLVPFAAAVLLASRRPGPGRAAPA